MSSVSVAQAEAMMLIENKGIKKKGRRMMVPRFGYRSKTVKALFLMKFSLALGGVSG